MERVKVLRIISRMNIGGPALQISGLMRGIDQDKVNQKLLTGYCKPDEADFIEIIAPELKVQRINGLGRSINIVADISALLQIIKIIREFKPNFIHTHTAKAGVLGRIAGLLANRNAKLIHTYHGHLLTGYFSPIKTKSIILVERILAKFSFKLICVGSKVRDDLLKVKIGDLSKYIIIGPGIKFGELPIRNLSRLNFNIDLDDIVIIFLGRITGIKRPDRFCNIVLNLARRHPKIRILIVGSGDLEVLMHKKLSEIKERVDFLGWRSDVENILACADILLLTSDNEGTPTSVIQAGMAGVPTVATNVGSLPEVIENGVTGILTDPDEDALAMALESLVLDPELRKNLGENAKKDMSRRYSISRMVESYQSLYLD
jgi:glycosyltransferase involved in cell wall biosynthesis